MFKKNSITRGNSLELLKKIPLTFNIPSWIKENIKDFFKLIYEVVFGQENGPRLGSFIKIFTKDKTIELINSKLNV